MCHFTETVIFLTFIYDYSPLYLGSFAYKDSQQYYEDLKACLKDDDQSYDDKGTQSLRTKYKEYYKTVCKEDSDQTSEDDTSSVNDGSNQESEGKEYVDEDFDKESEETIG